MTAKAYTLGLCPAPPMRPPRKQVGNMAAAYGMVVAAVVATTGILAFISPPGASSTTNPLAVYEDLRSFAYGPPPVNYYLGAQCGGSGQPVAMPATYDLATVSRGQNGTIIREAYFAVFLASGQTAHVSINLSAPLQVYVLFDNRTSIDTQSLAKAQGARSIESNSGSETDDYCLPDGQLLGQNEWYIFQILGGSFGQNATVTFDIQPGSSCFVAPAQG